jgi:hypothetical protein
VHILRTLRRVCAKRRVQEALHRQMGLGYLLPLLMSHSGGAGGGAAAAAGGGGGGSAVRLSELQASVLAEELIITMIATLRGLPHASALWQHQVGFPRLAGAFRVSGLAQSHTTAGAWAVGLMWFAAMHLPPSPPLLPLPEGWDTAATEEKVRLEAPPSADSPAPAAGPAGSDAAPGASSGGAGAAEPIAWTATRVADPTWTKRLDALMPQPNAHDLEFPDALLQVLEVVRACEVPFQERILRHIVLFAGYAVENQAKLGSAGGLGVVVRTFGERLFEKHATRPMVEELVRLLIRYPGSCVELHNIFSLLRHPRWPNLWDSVLQLDSTHPVWPFVQFDLIRESQAYMHVSPLSRSGWPQNGYSLALWCMFSVLPPDSASVPLVCVNGTDGRPVLSLSLRDGKFNVATAPNAPGSKRPGEFTQFVAQSNRWYHVVVSQSHPGELRFALR